MQWHSLNGREADASLKRLDQQSSAQLYEETNAEVTGWLLDLPSRLCYSRAYRISVRWQEELQPGLKSWKMKKSVCAVDTVVKKLKPLNLISVKDCLQYTCKLGIT